MLNGSVYTIAMHLIRRTIGSKRGIFLNLLLPAILLSVIAGLFVDAGKDKAVITVSNEDTGILGEYLVKSLNNENLYDVRVESNGSDQMMRDAVLEGGSDASIYVPSNFTDQLIAGERPQASVYRMNEQLWNISLTTRLQAEADKLAASADLIRNSGETGDKAATLEKLALLLDELGKSTVSVEEEEMRLGKTLSHPEMIGIMLMFVLLLVGQSIGYVMEDRELRTMARMYAAPLRSLDIAVGNFTGSLLLGTFQLIVFLGFSYFVFGFMNDVSFWALLLVLECFLFAAVGICSLIAGLVKNSTQLSQINNLFITPTCMISGCFWPISIMPDFMQKLANFVPQKWAIQAIDRLGGGGSIADIWLQLSILVLFAVVLISFGATVLKPSKASQ
ncbi:MAG: ABC transporter permease [Candidatus Pristimantibacillus sp.]